MIQIIMFTLLMSSPIAQKIKKLEPGATSKTIKWVVPTLKKWAPKAGFKTKDDMNLILAMIQKESSFVHKTYTVGNYGEWGLLQVIPWERHIRRAARKYKCLRSENKYHRYKKWHNGFMLPTWTGRKAKDPVSNKWFKVKWKSPKVKIKGRWYVFENEKNKKIFDITKHKPGHKIAWYNPCRCSPGNKKDCRYPNIGYFRGGTYKTSITKTMMFLRFSPRGALATGLFEMAYWKRKYDRSLKKRFWTKTPIRYFRKRGYNVYRSTKWWKRVKKDLGQHEWIVHYNYGGRLVLSQTARWYPYLVAKFYKKIS